MVTFDQPGARDPLAPTNLGPIGRYIPGQDRTYPGWDGSLGAKLLKDTGVVILDRPASTKWAISPAPLVPRHYWS
jgi:hypothetical protein